MKPLAPPTLRRIHRIEVMTNETERDLVKAAAARAGMTVPSWSRETMLAAARLSPEEER